MTLAYDIELYRAKCDELATLAADIMARHADALADWQKHRLAVIRLETVGESARWAQEGADEDNG